MSLDFERTEKLNIFKQDAAKHDITVRIPDVNRSEAWFAIDGNEVFYALSARNVGSQAMQSLLMNAKPMGRLKTYLISPAARPVSASIKDCSSILSPPVRWTVWTLTAPS